MCKKSHEIISSFHSTADSSQFYQSSRLLFNSKNLSSLVQVESQSGSSTPEHFTYLYFFFSIFFISEILYSVKSCSYSSHSIACS